jgi:hypothetical protein
MTHLIVRTLNKVVQDADFGNDVRRGTVKHVATKVAQPASTHGIKDAARHLDV